MQIGCETHNYSIRLRNACITCYMQEITTTKRYKIMKIPGMSFSLKRAVGVSAVKQKIARKTGIPTTKQGLERKIGGAIMKSIFGKKR